MLRITKPDGTEEMKKSVHNKMKENCYTNYLMIFFVFVVFVSTYSIQFEQSILPVSYKPYFFVFMHFFLKITRP